MILLYSKNPQTVHSKILLLYLGVPQCAEKVADHVSHAPAPLGTEFVCICYHITWCSGSLVWSTLKVLSSYRECPCLRNWE